MSDPLPTRKASLTDVAKAAGVSKAAASYALRGKRGVSEETRLRIESIAAEMGWEPPPARLTRARGRVGAVGLLVPQPVEVLAEESFTAHFISGLQAALIENSVSLVLDFEPDARAAIDIYRTWAELRVTRVILLDVARGDLRLTHLPRMGFDAVSTCPPEAPDPYPCVYTDDAADMGTLLRELHADGFRRFVHVSGPLDHPQVARRVATWQETLADLPHVSVAETVATDWVADRSFTRIQAALAAWTPQVMVFDSDRLAMLGLRATERLGLRVPRDLSLVSFDDSLLCRAVGMAALRRDPRELGRTAATELLRASGRQRIVLEPGSLATRRTYREPPYARGSQ